MINRLFENYRHFLIEDDVALLIEGRKDVALSRATKGIKNKLVKEKIEEEMQLIFALDPTGNQKYATWLGNMFNESYRRQEKYIKDQGFATMDYIDSVLATVNMTSRTIKANLVKYHKLAERNFIEKDINKFSDLDAWGHAVYKAEIKFNEKEEMKAMAIKAKSETDKIESNEDYEMVRPRSREASCYRGQGTTWCISATETRDGNGVHYFDKYSAEGQGFYFVFFHHIPQDDDLKKMALVYEPGSEEEAASIWNVPDEDVGEDGLRQAVELNLLFKGFYNSVMDKKAVKKRLKTQEDFLGTMAESFETAMIELREEDALDPTLKKMFEGLDIDLSEESTNQKNMASYAEQEFDEMISEQLWSIQGDAGHHFGENPAGPTDEDYQEIIDAAELKNVYVNFDEYDEGKIYWDGGLSYDFDNIDDLVEEAVDTEELSEMVRSALDGHYVYPDDVGDNSHGSSLEVYVRFNPDHGEQEGLEGLKSFVERMQEADEKYDAAYESVIDAMKEKGWIPGESTKALLEKFNEMKFQNFDVELEDGNVTMSSRLNIKLLLPEELRTGNRELPSGGGATRGTVDLRKTLWQDITTELKDYKNTSEIGNQLVERLKSVLERAMKIAASQMKLPLNEEKATFTIPEFNIQFGARGPKDQGSIGGHDSQGVRRDVKHDISDTYTYWLDVVIEGEETKEEIEMIQKFLRMIDKEDFFEKIRQYVEALVNNQMQKTIIPTARRNYEEAVAKRKEVEATTDELSNIFEGWRDWTGRGKIKNVAADMQKLLSPSSIEPEKMGSLKYKKQKSEVKYPHKSDIRKAIDNIYSELSKLSKESKIASFLMTMVKDWKVNEKNKWIWLGAPDVPPLTETAIGPHVWKRVFNLGLYIKKHSNHDPRLAYVQDLAEFLITVGGTRWTMETVGFNLEDVDPDTIPRLPEKN